MNGGPGLDEGTLEIGLVVVLAVMMRDITGAMLARGIANVGDTPIHHREHVLRGVLVEHPPFLAAGDVDGGRVGHESPSPAVVMRDGRGVARATASEGQPGVA